MFEFQGFAEAFKLFKSSRIFTLRTLPNFKFSTFKFLSQRQQMRKCMKITIILSMPFQIWSNFHTLDSTKKDFALVETPNRHLLAQATCHRESNLQVSSHSLQHFRRLSYNFHEVAPAENEQNALLGRNIVEARLKRDNLNLLFTRTCQLQILTKFSSNSRNAISPNKFPSQRCATSSPPSV